MAGRLLDLVRRLLAFFKNTNPRGSDEDLLIPTPDRFLREPELPPSETVFLCHSSVDKLFVRKLANDLHELGIDVWFDEWKMTAGDPLSQRIEHALKNSAFVCVLLTPDSIASFWCNAEYQKAFARERTTQKKVVVPLLKERVDVPIFFDDKLALRFGTDTNAPRYYEQLTKLVGMFQKLDTGTISRSVVASPPTNLGDVIKILVRAGGSPVKYIPFEQWRLLTGMLKFQQARELRVLDEEGTLHRYC